MAIQSSNKLIYIAPNKASFVNQDILYLKEHFEVKTYFFTIKNKFLVPFEMLKLFMLLLFSKANTYLISFGGYHSFVATIMARLKRGKAFIILNGTDSVSIPTFNYGHLRKGLMRYCCLKSYQRATHLLPVSESLMSTHNTYAFEDELLGINHSLPGLSASYQVVPNGFDIDFWTSQTEPRKKTVITVASSNRQAHKGIDLLVEFARRKPAYHFSIAGMDHIDNCPENVHCLGLLSADKLRDQYANHQYYFQLSIWEGFGCALCEAMLCGCIPIVSNVNMLPEIVGADELVLKERSIDALCELIEGIESKSYEKDQFRKSIVERFGVNSRIEKLKEVLQK